MVKSGNRNMESTAKVHPSNDPELDPDSYALEKFRLYETRAVGNWILLLFIHSSPNRIFCNWNCRGFTWSVVIGTRGSSGCWKSIGQRRLIWISAKTPCCILPRKSRACFSGLLKVTGPLAASLLSLRFSGLPVSTNHFYSILFPCLPESFIFYTSSPGCIKFLESYYLILVTKRRQIGSICGHAIYSIKESQLRTIPHVSIQSDLAHSKTELR